MATAPDWGITDIVWWKLLPERWGGGRGYIQQFKDRWVRFNKAVILDQARERQLPPELLAGVCWIEVGGDPGFIDRVAFWVRSFDWMGPAATDALTVTKPPEQTSFGNVSMQLRTAASTMGRDPATMTHADWRQLAALLQHDRENVALVARHLRQLAEHDGFAGDLPRLSERQVRIVGARYNRGIGLSLASIERNTSYGDFIVRFWPRFQALLR